MVQMTEMSQKKMIEILSEKNSCTRLTVV